MADNEYAGSACYVSWVWSAGTISLYTDARNFTYTPSIDFIDATAGADTARRRINSFKDGQATLSALAQSDGTAFVAACAEGVSGTLTWGLAGTASNKPKSSAPFISMGVTQTAPYSDVVTYDVTWQQNGARTDDKWT
jgi:hypothetical protein